MLSDRRKIANAKAVLRRRFTGPTTSSGQLVVGKFYRVTEFKTGDDFSNVGVPQNRCGLGSKGFTSAIFQATATTPTVWTHGSRLTELLVVDLRAKADELFGGSEESAITATSTSFEGGSVSGEITRDPDVIPSAIGELLAEMDPDYVSESTIPRRHGSVKVLVG